MENKVAEVCWSVIYIALTLGGLIFLGAFISGYLKLTYDVWFR